MDEANRTSAPARTEFAGKARTVLVVDTNPAVLQTVRAIFDGSAYRCVTAVDTVDALCALVEHRPLAVVADMDAGPLPFWQFCTLIHQHADFRATLLIASAGRDDAVEHARAAAANVDHFLARPYAREELLALLTRGVEAAA